MDKKRKSKLETADAIRAMDSRVVVEWKDLDPDRPRKKQKQTTLNADTLDRFLGFFGMVTAVAAIGFGLGKMERSISAQPKMAYPSSGEERPSPDHRYRSGGDYERIAIADTNSMDPVIDAGNMALAASINGPEDLKTGDIITFYDHEGDLVIHRLIDQGFGPDGAWWGQTKGDNNEYKDRPIGWNQVDKVIVGVLY